MFLKRISFSLLLFFYIFNFAFAEELKRNYFSQLLSSFCGSGCLNNSISRVNFGNSFFPNFISKSFPNTENVKTEENIFLTNTKGESDKGADQVGYNNVNEAVSNDEDEVINQVATDTDKQTKEKNDEGLLCKLNNFFCTDTNKDLTLKNNLDEQEEYNKKINALTEQELANNTPPPVPGTSEHGVWGGNGEGEQPYNLQPGQSYSQEDFSQSNLKPGLTNDDMKDFKLTGIDKNCEPFGVINKANNINVIPQVKNDLARICSAFQRKLVVVDAVRAHRTFSNPCQPPSRHLSAEAVDFEIKNYGSRQEQAMLIVAFIALGYNIGSYEDGYPLHADHGQCPHWQTWSRWAHKNGESALPYQQQVVDALSLMGIQARSAGELNRSGRKPRSFMVEKARRVIINSENDKLKEFLLPKESV